MPGYLAGHLLGLPTYKDRTTTFVLSAQETLYKAILVLLTVTAIVWMSVFLYATFYYSYMPAISHSRPVHLQFSRSCDRRKDEGLCNFPAANVTLTKRNNLLMVGQPYKILVELEMPESRANRELGMFLVCAKLRDNEGIWVTQSCRTAMLHYRSWMVRTLIALFYAPILLSGTAEEKQIVPVELFSNFEEHPERPITEAAIEIQSNYVEIYQTWLKIHAHFTGLRYFMFHWPVLSAFLGISTNLFFLTIIACLSWYKFFTPRQVTFPAGYDPDRARSLDERRAMARQRLLRERGRLINRHTPREIVDASQTKDELEQKGVHDGQPPDSSLTASGMPSGQTVRKLQVPCSDSEASSRDFDVKLKEESRRSSEEFILVQEEVEINAKDPKDEGENESAGTEIPIKHEADETVDQVDAEDKENRPIQIVDASDGNDSASTLRHRAPISKSSEC